MTSLFLKDEDIMTSPPVLGYKILALMHDRKIDKISIFDIADFFKNKKWFSVKNMYFAIIFLFTLGLVDFQQTYIYKIQNVNN